MEQCHSHHANKLADDYRNHAIHSAVQISSVCFWSNSEKNKPISKDYTDNVPEEMKH